MENLFTHLKDVFSTEPFRENQSAFTITVYTNLDYAADQVYAYVKRSKGSTNGHILLNKKGMRSNGSFIMVIMMK